MPSSKVLLIVEGQKKDVQIAKQLFSTYKLDSTYEIVSYNSNIFSLYNEMFISNEPSDMDIIQVLIQRETSEEKKKMLKSKYTDILLVFDLEPQDTFFKSSDIIKMQEYFIESTDMGRLYINYPMIEGFYHVSTIEDEEFLHRTCDLSVITNGEYKGKVACDTGNRIYNKLIREKRAFKAITNLNIRKAYKVLSDQYLTIDLIVQSGYPFCTVTLLKKQLDLLNKENKIYVMSTICMFIYEYNKNLLL